MVNRLNDNFLNELFRLFLFRKTLVERVSPHLKYQHLPNEEYKIIYRDILSYVNLSGTPPTIGVLFENNKANPEVVNLLNKIKDSDIVDPETILKQLEKYLKDARFNILWDDVVKLYKGGDTAKAIQTMAKQSTEIVEFSLSGGENGFTKVFNDFSKRQVDKQIKYELGSKSKVPFGILPCDLISKGGMDIKDTVLWIMRSGVGKSTVLKWQGMYACRLGFDVLHIQLEGAEEECFDKYTQIWSAMSYTKVKNGDIQGEEFEKLLDIANKMISANQDIYIRAFEQFNEASMLDVRDAVIEYIKERGKKPDLLILDSIDLVHPGDGLHYGVDTQSIKMKLQNSSRKFKNICNEFEIPGVTATQTSDVKLDVWNDPDKVITRSDSMGDKNIANSYSYVLTGNQTIDEEKAGKMRINHDKVRYYNPRNRVYPIATNYKIGRFIDVGRTKSLFKDVYLDE